MTNTNQPPIDKLPDSLALEAATLQVDAFESDDEIFMRLNSFTAGDPSVPNFTMYFRDGVDDKLREVVESRLPEYVPVDNNNGYYDIDEQTKLWKQRHYYDTGESFGTFWVAVKNKPKGRKSS